MGWKKKGKEKTCQHNSSYVGVGMNVYCLKCNKLTHKFK